MDTSETYIKMCEKAVEIQALRKPYSNERHPDLFVDGDVLFVDGKIYIYAIKSVTLRDWQDANGKVLYIATAEDGRGHYNKRKVVWLPRQDQLQEMVKRGREKFFPYNLLWRLYRAISTNAKGNIHNSEFTSMEQLWLAFVIKERWNKVWNNEDWILQNE
jgi:hypothetical protein